MKLSRQLMVEISICLLIVGMLLAIAIPNYHEGQVRPKNVYVFAAFGEFARTMRGSTSLPEHMTMAPGDPKMAGFTTYTDVYDRTKRPGAERIYCQVDLLGGSSGPIKLNFWGNPYKWHRLSDTRGLIYSYGPDEDDDLAQLPATDLASLTTETVQVTLQPFTYDSTNGTISNGDCWRFIDLDDRF